MDNLATMIDCESCYSWTIASYEYKRLQNVETEDEICKPRVMLIGGNAGNEEVAVAYDDTIIWSRYVNGQSIDIPSDFKTFSVPRSVDFILWTNFEFDQTVKSHDSTLVVIKDCHLSSFSFSGEYLQCKLSVEAKSVWPTRNNGLIVESKEVTSNKSYVSLSSLYNLTHPCDELAPVICCTKNDTDSNSVGQLTEFTAATKSSVVASLTSLNVLVTHDVKKGHSFWLVRKASELEKEAFYHQREAKFNEADATKLKTATDAMKTPRFEKIQNFSPIPSASMISQRMKMDSPMSDAKKYIPHSSPFAPKGSAFDPRSFTKFGDTTMLGMPWLEMPLTPNLCLQFIASDDEILKKHMPRFAASKVFESRDLLSKRYICLQIRQMETLFLYQLKTDPCGNQITSLEKAGFIQCEDSINVEDLPYMAILEKDASLTLYSGLHKMCKVRRLHTSPNLALSTYPNQIQTSLDDTIKDFKVSIGRKVIANTFGGHKLIYITLPGLFENSVVGMFLDSLKMYLDQKKYVTFVCEWFAVRNAVGKDVDKKNELGLFFQFLVEQVGLVFNQVENPDGIEYENCSSTAAGIEPMDDDSDSKTKKVRMTDSGSESDFTIMLASESVIDTLDLIGNFGFQSEKPSYVGAAICDHIDPVSRTKTTLNTDAPLCQHFELIIKISHLIYEESKLDIIKEPSSLLLAKFLAQLAHVLGMHKLKMQYLLDFPILSTSSKASVDASTQSMGEKMTSEPNGDFLMATKKNFDCFPDVLADRDRLRLHNFFPSLSFPNLNANCLSNYTAPNFVKWVGDLMKYRKLLQTSNDDYASHVKSSLNTGLFTLCCGKSSSAAGSSCWRENLYLGEEKTQDSEFIGKTAGNTEHGISFTSMKNRDDVDANNVPGINPFPCIWGVTERIIKTSTVMFYILLTEKSTRSAGLSAPISNTLAAKLSDEGGEKNNNGAAMQPRANAKGDNTAFSFDMTGDTMLSNRNFTSSAAIAPNFTCPRDREETMQCMHSNHDIDGNGISIQHVRNAPVETEKRGTRKDFTFANLLFRCVNGLRSHEKDLQHDEKQEIGSRKRKCYRGAYFSTLSSFFCQDSGKDMSVPVPPETANWILNVENIFMSRYHQQPRGAAVESDATANIVAVSNSQYADGGKTLWNSAKGSGNENKHSGQDHCCGNKNNGEKARGIPTVSVWRSSAIGRRGYRVENNSSNEKAGKIQFEPWQCSNKERKEFDLLGHVLLFMTEIGIDCDLVDTLPFGVSLPILNVIYEGHLTPSYNWPVRVINLVRRRDLLKRKDVIFGDSADSTQGKRQEATAPAPGKNDKDNLKLGKAKIPLFLLQKLGTQKQYILMEQRQLNPYLSSTVSATEATGQTVSNSTFRPPYVSSTASWNQQPVATVLETSGLEFDEEVLNVLFADDCRIQSVKRMLNSSQPVKIKAQPQQTDLQSKLARYAKRTMALPVGRGMLTLSSVAPTLTSTEPIPVLNFGARVLPKNIVVNLTSATLSANSRQWAHYHNGVAAGLRIDQNSAEVDTAWVVYNRPKSSAATDSICVHTGFLLGLALNGHLDKMSAYNLHSYLCRNHEMTNISLLLGLSASRQGSRDGMLTKTLTLHVNALLPSGGTELDVGCNVQITALLSVGFLFMRSADRHMAEVMLSQINRPPGPEMENCVNRESYSLTAGLSLGMILLGKGHNMFGGMKTGLTFTTQLYSYIKGGANPHAFSQNNCYQIQEGETINICMTSPGATLATGLIFFNTCSYSISDWFKPPETALTIDTVLPEHLMLHVIAKGLICWQEIVPYHEWVQSNFPPFLLPLLDNFKYPTSRFIEMAGSDTSSYQAFCNVIAGSCFVLGLRFAGMQNKSAFNLMLKYVKVFLHLLDHERIQTIVNTREFQDGSNPCFKTILNCLHSCLIALCMVMAGTGNLQLLSVIRYLHCKIENNFGYGHHMAVHMALGLLFLGRCQYTLRNDASSVAALLAAFYPVYPLASVDNKYHLQAFRHLYVKSAEPRLLLTRDIKTKHVERVPVRIGLKASLNYDNYIYETQTPCLIPQLDLVSTIEILSSDFPNDGFSENNAENYTHSGKCTLLGNYNSAAMPAAVCNPIKNVAAATFGNQVSQSQSLQNVACGCGLNKRNKTRSFLPLRIDFDQKANISQFSLLLKSCLFVQPYSGTATQQQPLAQMLPELSSSVLSNADFPHFPTIWGTDCPALYGKINAGYDNESEMSFACSLIDAFRFTATQFADRLEHYRSLGAMSVCSSCSNYNKRTTQILMNTLPCNSNLFLQQLHLVNIFVNSSDNNLSSHHNGNLIVPPNTPWLKYVHAKLLSKLMSCVELSKHSLLCLLNNRIPELLNALYSDSQRRDQLHCLTQFICFTGLDVFLEDFQQNKPGVSSDGDSNLAESQTVKSQMNVSENTSHRIFHSFWSIPLSQTLESEFTKNEFYQKLIEKNCDSKSSNDRANCMCGENVAFLKDLKPDLLESSDYYSFFLHKL